MDAMSSPLFDRQLSAIPGATSMHPSVLRAMQHPYVNPWSPEFLAVVDEVLAMLKQLYRTQNDVLVMMGPIRLAMDAVVCSLLEPDCTAAVAVNGHWSALFTEMIRAHGGQPLAIEHEWGRPVDPDEVRRQLDAAPPGRIKALFATHVETSTGVVNPVEELGKIARERNLLYVVDAAQTLGGIEVDTDAWGVDFCIGGNHKCMSAPAGLSYIAISERGWAACQKRTSPIQGWYTNLLVWRSVWMERQSGYFTFPTSLVFGLRAALDLLFGRSLPDLYRRYVLVARAVRRSLLAMGLELAPSCSECPGCESPGRLCADTVTTVRCPPGIRPGDLAQLLSEKYHISIAGTYGPLAASAFRVGPTGIMQLDPGFTVQLLTCLGLALKQFERPVRLEDGLAVAAEILSGLDAVSIG